MAEEAKKNSRNYNVDGMTYDLVGQRFMVTLEGVYVGEGQEAYVLNDSQKLALLIGYSNMVVDSVASMTKKDGFTDKNRLDKMLETHENINSGEYKKHRKETEKLNTAKVMNIADVIVKIMRGQSAEVSAADAEPLKKFSPEMYAKWEEDVTAE